MRVVVLSLTLLLPSLASAIELRNALGDDQRSETLTITIDDREIGTLAVDRKRPEAKLELPLKGPKHRYRISGEAVMADGARVPIAGAGLIVTSKTMDAIAEATDASKAFAAYEALIGDLRTAAPEFPIESVELHRGAVATDAELEAAERRLKRGLPKGYRDFMLKHGSFYVGEASEATATLFAPARVMTLEQYTLMKARENETESDQLEQMRAFIGKRYPQARRDLVLDVWQDEYPSVIRADGRCPDGELPYAFPESQWEILMGSGLDDNPFMALISYDDDIVGESTCMRFEGELAYALHDHLYEAADDVIYLLGDDEGSIQIERGDIGDGQERLWFRFAETDD